MGAYEGRICSGALDGSIRVWSQASEGHEQTLMAYEEDVDDEDEDTHIMDSVHTPWRCGNVDR
jgi:hypothetical protein